MDDGVTTLRRLVNSSLAFVKTEKDVLEVVGVFSTLEENSTGSIEFLSRSLDVITALDGVFASCLRRGARIGFLSRLGSYVFRFGRLQDRT